MNMNLHYCYSNSYLLDLSSVNVSGSILMAILTIWTGTMHGREGYNNPEVHKNLSQAVTIMVYLCYFRSKMELCLLYASWDYMEGMWEVSCKYILGLEI